MAAMASYMETCPTCQDMILTDIRNPYLIIKWQHRRGDAWGYGDNGTPCWLYCVKCHMRRWPNDRRYANGASRPTPSWLHREASGRQRLFAGDFWLIAPPPERASLPAGGSLGSDADAEETGSHSTTNPPSRTRDFILRKTYIFPYKLYKPYRNRDTNCYRNIYKLYKL